MARKSQNLNKCKLLHKHIATIASSSRLLRRLSRKAAQEMNRKKSGGKRKGKKGKGRRRSGRRRSSSASDIMNSVLTSRFGNRMPTLQDMAGPALGNSMSVMQGQFGMSPLQAARAYAGVPQEFRSFS